MTDSLPFRSSVGNDLRTTYVVLASRATNRDAAELVLRDEILADTPARAARFAVAILPGLVSHYGIRTDVQVLADGVLIFAVGGVR